MFCQFIFINTEPVKRPVHCYRHREKRAPNPHFDIAHFDKLNAGSATPEGGFEIFIIWLLRVKSGVSRPPLSAVCIGIAEKTEFIIMEPVKRPVHCYRHREGDTGLSGFLSERGEHCRTEIFIKSHH